MRTRVVAIVIAVLAGLGLGFLLLGGPGAPPANDGGGAATPPPPTQAQGAAVADAPPTAAEAPTRVVADAAAGDQPASLRVHVQWHDATPAQDLTVHVSRAVPGVRTPLGSARTDAHGDARFDRLAAGKVVVVTDRGHGKPDEAELAPGKATDVTVTLGAGVDVQGQVQDPAGTAVPFADIWLTAWLSPWMAGAVVARADAHGAFTLRSVPKDQSLGALVPGRAPSPLVDLDELDLRTAPVRVTLVVGPAGARLVGRVLAPDGRGVAGAMVAAGNVGERHDSRANGTMRERWSPRVVRTGHDGAFAIDSLPPGQLPVEAFAARFPIWHGSAALAADGATTLTIQLLAPVTVHGTVTGQAGKPLGAAVVRAFPVAIREDFLPSGQFDYDSVFGYPTATANADGSYRLEAAAPGDVHLYATPGNPGHGLRTVTRASAVLHGEPGQDLEWNPQVGDGASIVGVVRHRDGVPMAGLFVIATDPATGKHQAVNTDRQGRFRFTNLDRKPFDIAVQYWTAPKGTPPLGQREVWPDQGELELVAPFDAPKQQAPGSVRGRVDDAAHRLEGHGQLAVLLQLDDRSWSHGVVDGTGFAFDDVEPGRHQVVVLAGEDPILASGWFELQPAERKDLGSLVTQPAGALRLRLDRGPGTAAAEPTIYLQPRELIHARKLQPGKADECLADNLTAGEYRISAYADGLTVAAVTAKVVAGSEATATLRLRAAALRELVVEFPASVALQTVRVVEEGGEVLFDHQIQIQEGRPYRRQARLPLGRFVLEAVTATGTTRLPFAMTTLQGEQEPVRLVLP